MSDGSVYQHLHPASERWQYGTTDHGMSEVWEALLKRDPLGKTIVMTMEIVLGSDTVIRVATEAVSVTSSETGAKYDYQPILMQEPSVQRSYSVGSATSSVRSVSIQIPNKLIDVKNIIGSGYMLAGIGEISLQIDGGDYEDRYVLIRGSNDDGVSFGAQDGEFVQLDISDPKETADLKLAPFEVDDERWPKAYENAIGNRYPVVLNNFNRVPALLVHSDRLIVPIEERWLVCWGHSAQIAATGAVYVNGSNEDVGDDWDDYYNYAVVRYVDGKGTPVTLVDLGSPYIRETVVPNPSPPPTNKYVQFPPGTDASIYVEVTGGSLGDTLIAVMTMLIEGFTALGPGETNYALLGKAESRLGGIPVNGCVNGSSTSSASNTMQFIEGELLASFPMVSMVWTNGKYGPVVTDRRDSYYGADLVVGTYPLFARISDVQESPKSSLQNSFTLRYAYDPLEDNYTKSKTLDHTNSALCSLSQMQAGYRVGSPIDSLLISDDTVAAYVMEWMIQHLTFPSYYVEYKGAVWMFFNLDVGDNITLTDAEFGWDQEVATIEKLEYTRGICMIGLRVWWRYSDLSGAASTIFSFDVPVPRESTDPVQ